MVSKKVGQLQSVSRSLTCAHTQTLVTRWRGTASRDWVPKGGWHGNGPHPSDGL